MNNANSSRIKSAGPPLQNGRTRITACLPKVDDGGAKYWEDIMK